MTQESRSSLKVDFWRESLRLVSDANKPDNELCDVVDGEFVLIHPTQPDAGGGSNEDLMGDLKAFLMILKSYLGTAILILPRCFDDGGIVASCIILVVTGLISIPCFLMLGAAADHVQSSKYTTIALGCLGKRAARTISALVVLSQLSCCVMNFAFLSQTIKGVFENLSGCNNWAVRGDYSLTYTTLLLIPILVTPLVLVRKIPRLALPILMSDFTIVVGLLVMTIQAVVLLASRGLARRVNYVNWSDFLVLLGTDIFTFEGSIITILPIRNSMKNPGNFPMVLCLAVMARVMVFLVFSATQYLAYGGRVENTAILNMPANPASVFLFIPYCLAIAFLFPQIFHPATIVIESFLGWPPGSGRTSLAIKMKKNIFRFILLSSTAGASVLVRSKLDIFTSMAGVLFFLPLVFIFPPLCYNRVKGMGFKFTVSLVVLALLIMGGTLIQSVMLAVSYPEEVSRRSRCFYSN